VRAAQRGWVGLVVILIALVIVAVLAQTVLKSYGLLSAPPAAHRAEPRPAEAAAADAGGAPPVPAPPMDRARGLQQQVQRDAQELEKRIDDSTR
jgi:hypothetical protein